MKAQCKAEGSTVLGGDPVVTLEGAVPLPKLYSTDNPSLLFFLSLILPLLPYNNLSHSCLLQICATSTLLHWVASSVLWTSVT